VFVRLRVDGQHAGSGQQPEVALHGAGRAAEVEGQPGDGDGAGLAVLGGRRPLLGRVDGERGVEGDAAGELRARDGAAEALQSGAGHHAEQAEDVGTEGGAV
jgi:hypothetical protein